MKNNRVSVYRQAGFTLVELLIAVSVMIIVVGVTGDIVVSLVRSYSKTQITNEIEQNANFIMAKLEKELRNATTIDSVTARELEFTRRLSAGSSEIIRYEIKDDGRMIREVNGGGEILLSNDNTIDGVYVDPSQSSFSDTSPASGPTVININLTVRQQGNPAVQFRQDINLSSTIVVRGSY